MSEILLTTVFVVLLVDVVVAFVVTARRPVTDRWLLSLLLSGTTGAALVALLTVLLGPAAASRFPDVAVVLIGLASLTAVVRLTAARTPGAARGSRTSPAPLGGGAGA
ncbi:hypothetical protein KocCE7_09500 [Kocuria marina subsp. indica]|uniref:hypothetical protein n=1 Tax=Kocuria TaxID=57493 RepID=UPI00103E51AE|nr:MULTISPECIES: hypothetical protein [Kocuria]MDT0118678.1 hypothetical protein [Kocuria sp. PD6]QBJ21996.1 hypothetical protein KocCE7_09500 [Kocuria indica]